MIGRSGKYQVYGARSGGFEAQGVGRVRRRGFKRADVAGCAEGPRDSALIGRRTLEVDLKARVGLVGAVLNIGERCD